MLGIAVIQVQDLALGLVEFHEVIMGPTLQFVQVSLDGIPSLQCVTASHSLVVSVNSPRMPSVPLSMFLTKFVKQLLSNDLGHCNKFFLALAVLKADPV